MKLKHTLPLVLISCGPLTPKAETTHTVRAEGTAEVKHTVNIKFEVCDAFEDPTEKAECVTTLLELLQEAMEEESVDD